jgi:Pvc16 N-terminal domain
MIHEALAYIRRELRDRLPVADAEVMIESARVLASQNNAQGAYITLVNVEEEPALRNLPTVERIGGALQRQEPPIHLNIYLLFSFEFQTYETSLLHLSNTIGLFQEKRVYTAGTASVTNLFPAGLEKLIFELHNTNFEALNNLWGVMGGAYFPSVIYKVRMVRIQAAQQGPADEITTIALNTAQKSAGGGGA